jgi:perosamine synthetase
MQWALKRVTKSSSGDDFCGDGGGGFLSQARPVLVDCCRDTLNLDVHAVERKITEKTKAMIPVDIAGQPRECGKLLDIARRNDLRIIEDAAHALPAAYGEQKVGRISDLTCFSFYATKMITTGEGGMATTENPDWGEAHGNHDPPWD